MKSDKNAIATRRNQYIESLNELYIEDYGNWLAQQSEEKKARISRKASSIKHGLSTSAPIVCKGPSACPFFSACPIPENYLRPGPPTDYPIGKSCVLEVEYVAQQVMDYMVELDVDPGDPVEMSLINELALLDLLRSRAVLVMAHGDKRGHGRDLLTIDEAIIGFDKNGNALMSQSTKVHPAVDIMERHEKRRLKILEKFNATRESKVKVFGGNVDNHTKLQQDIEAIRAYMEAVSKGGLQLSAETDEVLLLEGKPKEVLFRDTMEVIK